MNVTVICLFAKTLCFSLNLVNKLEGAQKLFSISRASEGNTACSGQFNPDPAGPCSVSNKTALPFQSHRERGFFSFSCVLHVVTDLVLQRLHSSRVEND